MSVSTKLARLARTSVVARSQPYVLRSNNDIREREEAFENQYVKEKERNDLRLQKERQEKQQKQTQSQSQAKAPKETSNPNAAKIKELENQLAAIQKELNQLKK
ncbi:hypothetical protein DICPUDRAFT_85297 [Dictyostelium purpureum]|uniref:Uncharacterized protein n=1 Tax=Dictyostelium purpureum TaxID=5786 RepID=F1A5A4_DICPU|nr:uncharacterized protein DICPUDRAFT_85297 [Dictyostelium purpureum]EGC28625.1 hypothetical protein DICPUDRAFT_85297 [Dictyostelium purpureum]|eukprot:XP_003294848.1 hypothetical protein DICPUDRAFT_85297 [Dictyostelium purpureum]